MNESVLDPAKWSARWSDLPEAARTRLRRAIEGGGDLAPLHVDLLRHVGAPAPRPEAIAALAGIGMAAVAAMRFGDPCHPREGPGVTLAFAALGYVTATALVEARARRRSRTGIAPGRYVFPTDLVAIDAHMIEVTPLAAVRAVTRDRATLTLHLASGGVEILVVPDERAQSAIEDAVAAVRRAVETGDRGSLFDRDVLAAARGGAHKATGDALGPYRAAARRARPHARATSPLLASALLALPALLAGAALGPVRNAASDAVAVARLERRLDALGGPEDPERARLLHDARCYVGSLEAASRETVEHEVIAPLALAIAEAAGDEESWRALLHELPRGPTAERARRELERIEGVRMTAFVREDLPPPHRAAIEALGRAWVRDRAPLVIRVHGEGSDSAFDGTIARELERLLRTRTRATGLPVTIEGAARPSAVASRLEVAWSTSDAGLARARVTLAAPGATWSSSAVADEPRELASAIAGAVLPPRPAASLPGP